MLFCLAEEVGTLFLVRTCVDRLAEDGNHTIADEMDEVSIKGLHRIKVKDDKGDPDEALLEIRFRKLRILPPVVKQKKCPALTLTMIHVQERGRPKRIEWKLLTNLPIRSGRRLVNLIAVFCSVSWRVFWMTMLNRSSPNAIPQTAPTDPEIRLLDHLVKDRRGDDRSRGSALSHYVLKIARLGGPGCRIPGARRRRWLPLHADLQHDRGLLPSRLAEGETLGKLLYEIARNKVAVVDTRHERLALFPTSRRTTPRSPDC
ncbi:hypothetical protein I6F35_35545 [Bradyrhizobium sp. BRP22]|uniref:hypothetical protein n=1 Tax=Bradyrhizobium sp. BRP22 TaxID=2793821 RepID=UPI001CD41BEC|nr:hypothetical protein [Bradyrhizobium sp. BRP22]MCA1458424.1 hypothetical protein [Bradyrhizobium sp. BRP22]